MGGGFAAAAAAAGAECAGRVAAGTEEQGSDGCVQTGTGEGDEPTDSRLDLQYRHTQGQGDEGIGFALPSFSSFTPTDTAHSPTLQRAMRELLANPGAVHAEEERWRRRLGLGPTSRESVFEAMRRRLQAEERGASPSKRQLRLAAAVQGALSDCFYRDGLCPATKRGDGSPMVDITEVTVDMCLRGSSSNVCVSSTMRFATLSCDMSFHSVITYMTSCIHVTNRSNLLNS